MRAVDPRWHSDSREVLRRGETWHVVILDEDHARVILRALADAHPDVRLRLVPPVVLRHRGSQ